MAETERQKSKDQKIKFVTASQNSGIAGHSGELEGFDYFRISIIPENFPIPAVSITHVSR